MSAGACVGCAHADFRGAAVHHRQPGLAACMLGSPDVLLDPWKDWRCGKFHAVPEGVFSRREAWLKKISAQEAE